MNGDTQTLLQEAYNQVYNSTLTETTTDELIAYYDKRAKELADNVKFYFDYYQKTLSIMCDVLHTDSILAQVKDPNYNLDNFELSDYIPDVVDALNAEGIKAGLGAAFKQRSVLLGTTKYTVSVNDYHSDSLTTQIDIDNIDEVLKTKPEAVLQIIDTFILKMVKVKNRLSKKYPV